MKMSIPNFRLILRWIRVINVFLGLSSLLIICNLHAMSNLTSKKDHVNPNNFWNWERQLENENVSRLVIDKPSSLMSGYDYCVETHSFYKTLREKRAQLYLSPGFGNMTETCPDPNLEIASISIATCCLLYSIFMLFVGESKRDIRICGDYLFQTVFGLLLLSSVLIYYFYTDSLVDMCYIHQKYAEEVTSSFIEYLQNKSLLLQKEDGEIILEIGSLTISNETNHVPSVHTCANEFKVIWRYLAIFLSSLNATGLLACAVISSTNNTMEEAVDNAIIQVSIEEADDAARNREEAPVPVLLDDSTNFLNLFDVEQDDEMDRLDTSKSLTSVVSVNSSRSSDVCETSDITLTEDTTKDIIDVESGSDLYTDNNNENERSLLQI